MIRHDQGSETGAGPLLRPVALGDLEMPNRVVMAPLTRGRASGPGLVPADLHAAYYGQRAAAGLIVAEAAWVGEGAIGFPGVPGIFTERQVEGWRRVTDVVHALGGRIVLQLWHTGAHSHPDHLGGARPGGPSAVDPGEVCWTAEGPKATVTPREMTRAEIERAVADFGAASARARRAGFDGVEVAANGTYLLAQFLNPRLNRRADGYGTDRARLLLEVVDAVAAAWDGRRTGVRLSPYWTVHDTAPGARGDYPYTADEATLADYDALAAELGTRPLAYLHLRGRALTGPDAAPDLDEFARYRKLFDGPLIANHGFGRDSGGAVVEAGIADAVSFGRAFIANPDLVARFALGQSTARSDEETHYGGGARGYLDYPICPGP
ncbi:alkene reductase [Actinomadura sp. WMMA1423]|uniref:alkene reductase n=1 Tax=Actinomadura sp. WMMA1423 TaxID=2591108 RepID=UPI001146B36B|nr:alkene reductase [Actinomadura sp. WMMA1423]